MINDLRRVFLISLVVLTGFVSCTSDEGDGDLTDIDLISQSDSDSSGLPDDTNTDSLTITDENKLPDNEGDDVDNVIPGVDSDGDGIPDDIEKPGGVAVDTDEDGTPDYLDDDSDGDGIPDSIEGVTDTDGDGTSDYRDTDSDGDNILDNIECKEQPCVDTDGDGIADFLDSDSDGDTIPDLIEGTKDSDKDTIPDYLDDDSDGDGILDKDEAGTVDIPADSDGDGYPDYIDLDSDNDGLSDTKETELGTDPAKVDTDGDGFDDNTEVAAGSDPLVSDPEFYDGQFYVVLPYMDPEKNDMLEFGTQIKMADIAISLDLSGSMRYAIDNIKADISSIIISGIKAVVPDPAFSISSFSNIEGYPYAMNQTVSKDAAAIQTALDGLGQESGGEIESQYEAIYQAVTGAGFDGEILKFDTGSCFDNVIMCAIDTDSYYKNYATVNIPSQNCTGQLGTIGGACFREHALPIVMMITDEQLYDINQDWVSDTGGYVTKLRYKWSDSKPDKGHYESETIAAFNAKKAKFIGVIGEGVGDILFSLQERMDKLANDTGSKNAITGENFVFQIDMAGKGLSNQIVEAVSDLLNNIQMDIDTTSESVTNIHGIDTTQFIKEIFADHSNPVNAYESKSGATFTKVKPGVKLFFDLTFENTIFEPTTTENTLFLAKITVYGEGALLDTRNVYIIVPGIKDDGGIKD
ncbi:MAG TPA: hypothetical protein PKG52_13020 [bacterium]|nr:hypothetical protein [bacterium]HPS30520.1 hypothetical protein [bacterium]